MTTDIHFTTAASEYIKSMLEKNPGQHFRLSVKQTGCSGFSYFPTLVTEKKTHDQYFIMENGITILIDSMWLSFFNGLQVDYVIEDKSGLKQKRLVFSNPNESSRCGCGESFHIE